MRRPVFGGPAELSSIAMQPLLTAKLLVLVSLANGAPVLAKKILGDRLAQPIDFGAAFIDRRPLFGHSKTIRGAGASLLLTAAAAPALGLELTTGATVGGMAMAGDLCSSFIKRRCGLVPSSRATGLDQIPESLLPLVACSYSLPLTAVDILVGVAGFAVGEILLSRVLYRIGLRDRPY